MLLDNPAPPFAPNGKFAKSIELPVDANSNFPIKLCASPCDGDSPPQPNPLVPDPITPLFPVPLLIVKLPKSVAFPLVGIVI